MEWKHKGQVSVARVSGTAGRVGGEEVEEEAGGVLEAEGIGTETVGGGERSLFSVGTTMLRSRSVKDGHETHVGWWCDKIE